MRKQFKKIIATVLTATMAMSISVPVFASETSNITESQQYIIDKYDELYEKNNNDNKAALDELVATHDSLELVAYNEYYVTNGEISKAKSAMTDVVFSESMVYDSDWGTYVYASTWEWINLPDESNLEPWDFAGFYIEDPSQLSARELIVYGYNSSGRRVGYINTDINSESGDIALGYNNNYGCTIWVDESTVVEGRIVVPLNYVTGSTTKIHTSYCHSYSTSSVSGIGGSVGIGSVGFDISWNSGVSSWGGVRSTWGLSIQDV